MFRPEHYLAVTNRHLCEGDFLTQIHRICVLHPCGLILREKDLLSSDDKGKHSAYAKLAEKVMRICGEHDVRFFVHSDLETARMLGCRRIHLPFARLQELHDSGENDVSTGTRTTREDSPAANTGSSLRDFDEISVSCHSIPEVEEAGRLGATQIILGTIFETDCKPGLAGKGLLFLADACAATTLPVYAIGGIKPENIESVLSCGAAGGCMMSGFMNV